MYRLLLILLVAGCVPSTPRTRADVSSALEERTARGVGERRQRASAPDGVDPRDGLTVDEVVACALWNNADFQATLAQLGFAEADLQQAGAIPNPVFSFFMPLGVKQLEMFLAWGIDWLWARPYRVAAAKLDVKRVAEQLVEAGLETARRARVTFYQLHLGRERLQLQREAAETWAGVANIARSRLAAGAASQLEVTAVESDARTAAIEAKRQAQQVQLIEAQMQELLNMPEPLVMAEVILKSDAAMIDAPTLPSLLRQAQGGRPEIRAWEMAVEAAGERAGLATAEIFDLILIADANGQGPLGGGFNAGPGLSLTLPLFDQNQQGHTRAEAELEAATWRYIGAQRRVDREVRVAYHGYVRASEALTVWPTEVVRPLQENVGRAERAYRAGGTSYLEVLDATRRLIDARLRRVELELEARTAEAALHRSVGGTVHEG